MNPFEARDCFPLRSGGTHSRRVWESYVFLGTSYECMIRSSRNDLGGEEHANSCIHARTSEEIQKVRSIKQEPRLPGELQSAHQVRATSRHPCSSCAIIIICVPCPVPVLACDVC